MMTLICDFRGPLVKALGRSQVAFKRRNFFLINNDFSFYDFHPPPPPILLSLLSLNFYQTVRHSPGERSRDIAPDNSRGYFVAWWEHFQEVIRMRMGEWCFASEFPYCGHLIV